MYDAVASDNQGKVAELMEIMWYWLRKQIWERVVAVMIESEKDKQLVSEFIPHDINLTDKLYGDLRSCSPH